MSIGRRGALACAGVTLLVAACVGTRFGPDAPAGISFSGHWRLDVAASDDPQKALTQMRAEARRIIARNAAAQGRGGPDSGGGSAGPGDPGEDAGAHGPHRDPLERSPMAHIIENVAARGEFLSVQQRADEIVFDYGTSRRSFTPGQHSVVSAEGGVGDQTSGWHGRDYQVVIKAQAGPTFTETYSLSADGKRLTDRVHLDSYELPAVTLTRFYDATDTIAPRQVPTSE